MYLTQPPLNYKSVGKKSNHAFNGLLALYPLFIFKFLQNSQSTIPNDTEMFRECLVPNCGISITAWLISTTSCCTPFTSFPKTSAYFLPDRFSCAVAGDELSGLRNSSISCSFIEFSACSMLTMV